MDKFKFILSKEKFDEIGGADDTVFTAKLISDDTYIVKWDSEDGWEGTHYSKADVEENLRDEWWVKVS